MKICFLADSESIHTKRWCTHFLNKGNEVSLISFKKDCNIENVNFYHVNTGEISVHGGNWKVLLKSKAVKSILHQIKPNILHAHYATSYGIVGALSNFHPYIITALGSDVLVSPKNSIMYRLLLRYAFNKADWITAMANHMKVAINNIGPFDKKTEVVPFGIDTNLFNANNRVLPDNKFVITSTRNFEDIYNIPHLIKAVAQIKGKIPSIELHLIGDGTKRKELIELVNDLHIEKITTFYGKIEQQEMVTILNQSHVFTSVSLSDGNNISLNEAMACGCFPIATNIEANTQWITHEKNGYLVEIDDVDQLANLILQSYKNYNDLTKKSLPINQNIIAEKADWHKNLKIVENKYIELTNG